MFKLCLGCSTTNGHETALYYYSNTCNMLIYYTKLVHNTLLKLNAFGITAGSERNATEPERQFLLGSVGV